MKRFRVVEVNKRTGEKLTLPKIFKKEKDVQHYVDIVSANNENSNINYVVKEIPIIADDCPECAGRGVKVREEIGIYLDGVIIPFNNVVMCDCCHGTGIKEYMLIDVEEVGLWQF